MNRMVKVEDDSLLLYKDSDYFSWMKDSDRVAIERSFKFKEITLVSSFMAFSGGALGAIFGAYAGYGFEYGIKFAIISFIFGGIFSISEQSKWNINDYLRVKRISKFPAVHQQAILDNIPKVNKERFENIKREEDEKRRKVLISIENADKRKENALLMNEIHPDSIMHESAQRDIFEDYQSISDDYTKYTFDIMRILKDPLLNDMSFEPTQSFILNLEKAKSYKPQEVGSLTFSHPFVDAVSNLKVSWVRAKQESSLRKLNNYSKDEIDKLHTARNLMSIAIDGSGNVEERQIAYKRAIKELEGLIVIPEDSIKALESNLRREIEETSVVI